MAKYRVIVDLTHPEEVVAHHAVFEDNGALTFRDEANKFIVSYANGVWRKVVSINDQSPQPS